MADRPDIENDFEAWAQLAARLRVQTPSEQQETLRQLGCEGSWPVVNESWSKCINEDISAGRMERPRRYAQLCRDEAARRRADAAAPAAPPAASTSAADAKAGDFRDALTPTAVQPPQPKIRQHETSGAVISAVAAEVRAQLAAELKAEREAKAVAPEAAAGGDFRKMLVRNDATLRKPSAGQIDTVSEVGHTDVVEAARQAETASGWSVDKYAQLCADLEREPGRETELWEALGVTSPLACEHIQKRWRSRLEADPELKTRWLALFAQHRIR